MTEATDRAAARDWARSLLAKDDWLILDTETTGLHSDAEIVQIAIAAPSGQILLDTLVKPTRPIPPAATRIHGIRDADVAGAPTFAELAPQIRELLSGATVVIYNADYDNRLLEQSAAAHDLTYEVPIFGADKYDCAMRYGKDDQSTPQGVALFNAELVAAMEYARYLMNPQRLNWVRVEWIWF